ncbi:hypothetical protein TrRE_jg11017 [Triparma retinervis]|uniref:MAGE domain-containing protein n=1 Tax=Triparma retinervis TaxID=2557542 RepID=A0A9W7A776_9STRA|nr:hypothetical protein TrRE_jg11017 [Triparma retinervis]
MPKNKRRLPAVEEDEVVEAVEVEDDEYGDDDNDDNDVKLLFTQEAPEFSESFVEPLEKEVARASELPGAVKSKLVNDMLRYFILKGLGKEFIEKKKAVDDVMGEYKKEKIASVILDEATKKLKALYGWSVMQVPDFMHGSIPAKFKGRMYIGDQADRLHRRFDSGQNGLLMFLLMVIYNKGVIRSDTRAALKWCTEEVIFKAMNDVDGTISSEAKRGGGNEIYGLNSDIESLLARFVEQDYLIRDKVKVDDDSSGVHYTLGPRSALEVGRKQLVFFTANILGEQEPDPTMLRELDDDSEEEEEEN